MTEHQTALLGRKNLSGAEVKMLQNCAVKARYDKLTNEFQNYFFSARSGVYPTAASGTGRPSTSVTALARCCRRQRCAREMW